MNESLTVSATVEAPIVTVWDYWNKPEHAVNWYSAQESFRALTAATDTEFLKKVSYKLDDNRKVNINFAGTNCNTVVTFDLEDVCQTEQQKDCWQSMLNQFKRYAETNYESC